MYRCMHLFLFISVCGCVYLCIACGMYDWGYVHVYIWYLYNCSLLGGIMCICGYVPVYLWRVYCVMCLNVNMYFCRMFIVFVVSEYYMCLQGSVKVSCVCGVMCMNVRVQMYICVICMCRWYISVVCTCVWFVVYEGANKYCMWYVYIYVWCTMYVCRVLVLCADVYMYYMLWVVCLCVHWSMCKRMYVLIHV